MPKGRKSAQSSLVLKPGSIHPRIFFLHFFDVHFLEERGEYARSQRALEEMELAVRFAVILGSRILVPAASYHESDIAARVLRPFIQADAGNLFALLGGGSSLEEFRLEKLEQYRTGSKQHKLYSKRLKQSIGWGRRKRSATRDISSNWMGIADDAGMYRQFSSFLSEGANETALEQAWRDVPERLGKEAFIVPHVVDLLPVNQRNLAAENALHNLVNRFYFDSYARDFPNSSVFQKMSISAGDIIPSGKPTDDIDFPALVKHCRVRNILRKIRNHPIDKLETLAFGRDFVEAFTYSQTNGFAQMTNPAPERYPVDLAILTALPKEREAVEAVFGKGRDKQFKNDPHIYKIIDFKVGDATKTIAVGVLSAMGNTRSGVTSTDFLRSFDAKHTVMVGIAGGCPLPEKGEDDIRLGDVVIGESVLEYDYVKRLEDGSVEVRDSPQRLSYSLTQVVRSLQSYLNGFDTSWLPYRDEVVKQFGLDPSALPPDELLDADGKPVARADDPRRVRSPAIVHFARIGAGDTLLKDPITRDFLRQKHSIAAVEMESAGLRDAGWARSKEIGVVRGVVDYCDGNKDDKWHIIGAISAAAVTRLLFEKLVLASG